MSLRASPDVQPAAGSPATSDASSEVLSVGHESESPPPATSAFVRYLPQQQQQQHSPPQQHNSQQQPAPEQQPPPTLRLSVSRILGTSRDGAPNGFGQLLPMVRPPPSSPANNEQSQVLKFSIDNILKADFGRRITDPISLKRARKPSQPAQLQRPIDLSKDFAATESSSEGSERALSDAASPSGASACSPGPHSHSQHAISQHAAQPSPSPVAASTATEPGKLMQWPAWVYCTRYSDRPSSGKYLFLFYILQ